ncbi:MAG TPA: SDR family NAD(P)-dependent oxidoreductase [Pyrinomonadaceae bacterium]|nr:SDR family NAD(P)-dependent oxidoreductase [Pyrinomonadaceae bacterium]
MTHWTNKVVFLTGASSGIGKGLALEIGRQGAKLGLVARRAAELAELVQELETKGAQAIALPADVQDANALSEAADRLRSEFGPIDMLIANAGVGATSPSTSLQPDQVARVVNINLLGAANSVAAVLPEMVSRGSGHLVAISSLAAYRGLPKSAAYCGSKAGLSAFFESVRLDVRDKGVRVTIIHPGFIKTPLTAGREATMPFLLELDDAVKKIVGAIEKGKKSYSFPWQLAAVVRAGMIMPNFMYDWLAVRNSYRE